MAGHSKIQLQVLSLYRQCLRAARSRPGAHLHIREEFKKNSLIAKSDTIRIEYLLRRGYRQLDLLNKPTVQSIGVFEKDKQ